jgi:hypothetical protein
MEPKESPHQSIVELRNRVKEILCENDFIISDIHLSYVLKYCSNDVQAAFEKLNLYINLRFDISKDGVVSRDDIMSLSNDNFAYWHSQPNKNGALCLVVKSGNFKAFEYNLEEVLKYFLYLIDVGEEVMKKTGQMKFCVIIDRDKYDKDKNSNPKLRDGMLKKQLNEDLIMANFFERLDAIYVINVNWAMRLMINAFRLFYKDPRMDKVKIMGDSGDLVEYFEKVCLPEEFNK